MSSVYLAGPIAGLSYDGCTDWREYARGELSAVGIDAFSPMRAKHYLADLAVMPVDSDALSIRSVLSSNRGITTRDRFDATRCDMLLVNLLGAQSVSIGTVMEIAWADLLRKPIVCAIDHGKNPHHHGMINEAIGFQVASLAEALEITKAILLP